VKRSSRMHGALLLFLCALTAALGYVNWRVLQLEPAAAAPAEGRIVLASTTAVPALDPAPTSRTLSDFDEIVRRPVFNASRRPFVVPEPTVRETAAPAPLPPPDMRLIGVAIDGSKKRALLRNGKQPNGHWVQEGESIEGWQVRSVRSDAVIVASGQQAHELRLYPASSAKQ
jgi:hypothetical protein